MGSIPTFLLQKLYVKGSLKNTASGFTLTIQNTIAPGTIVGMERLQIDGVEYPIEQTGVILADGGKVSVTNISAESPLRFGINTTVTIEVQSKPLPAGRHKLLIPAKTKEAGMLHIPAEDTIA